MNDNLNIWNKANNIDPKYTKAANVGGHKSTSINGAWVKMKLTEIFGSFGSGWGYKILEERYDEGAPIFHPPSLKTDNPIVLFVEKTHTIKLMLWYMVGDKKIFTSEDFGHTPYIYQSSKGGIVTDKEAPKKSLTDAIKRCASTLGIAADVYLGEFDDRDYVEAAKAESEISSAIDKDKAIEQQKSDLNDQVKNCIDLINESTDKHVIGKLYKGIVVELSHKQKLPSISKHVDALIQRVYQAYNDKLQSLEGDK